MAPRKSIEEQIAEAKAQALRQKERATQKANRLNLLEQKLDKQRQKEMFRAERVFVEHTRALAAEPALAKRLWALLLEGNPDSNKIAAFGKVIGNPV